jgi:uncharacterized protein RhaS with RHS repeats
VEIDPIGQAGGLNQYAYAGQNPVQWIDPSGLVYHKSYLIPGENDPNLVKYVNGYILSQNYNLIVAHGSPDGWFTGAEGGVGIMPEYAAQNMLGYDNQNDPSKNYDPKQETIVVACKGGTTGAALQVAKEIHHEVLAYPQDITYPRDANGQPDLTKPPIDARGNPAQLIRIFPDPIGPRAPSAPKP